MATPAQFARTHHVSGKKALAGFDRLQQVKIMFAMGKVRRALSASTIDA
jgi:hypothetical protein